LNYRSQTSRIPNCDATNKLTGRLVALDLGQKRVGVAVSDEMQITFRPLPALPRTNWKQLLRDVTDIIRDFDARALIIGLPLSLDGTQGSAAQEATRLAHNFALSLNIPVYLQDERLTTREAEENLRLGGHETTEIRRLVDSEAATIILRDFLLSEDHLTPMTYEERDPSSESA
jgi:putative pre-16S rRNA nuclease